MSGSRWTQGRHEDQLPWLESAEVSPARRRSFGRILVFVVLALALLALVIAVVEWMADRPSATGTGDLIEAQEGDYKVKPDEPGGMRADGEGDTVFATSEGETRAGRVDLNAIPEAPIAAVRPKGEATPAVAPPTKKVVAEVPRSGGALTAQAPARQTVGNASTRAAPQGSVVQLGSFPSEAGANAEWKTLGRRFGYLADLPQSVERAEVGGATVYRLRVAAGGSAQARDLCGRLKVAGEACFVVP